VSLLTELSKYQLLLYQSNSDAVPKHVHPTVLFGKELMGTGCRQLFFTKDTKCVM